MPLDCSPEAAAISLTMSFTRVTAVTISSSVRPTSFTELTPTSTLPSESWMSDLVSFAASALRWARRRTSSATTAKPRPWSPARAASTAALRARRLVWKAISSMVVMISPILFDAVQISPIAPTASRVTLPPRSATSRALVESWRARSAFSAFCFTALVICSRLDAVSSRLDACS